MSYHAQSQLESDPTFQGRVRAVNVQQANTYKDDGRGDVAATADAVLRDDPGPGAALLRLAAAGPGIADTGRHRATGPSTRRWSPTRTCWR